MILRSWHGAVPTPFGDAFERYLEATGSTDARATSGNLGVFVKRVAQEGLEHFFFLSFWDDWDSIRTFAGPSPHLAVTYPEDRAYGLISDPIVLHHEVSSLSPWLGEHSDASQSARTP